jgi:hypothetical protein
MAYALSRNPTSPKRRSPATTRWVLTQMRDRGAALHRHHDRRRGPVWTLANGREVEDHVAAQVVKNPSVIGVGDALFKDVPSQTYRWVGI